MFAALLNNSSFVAFHVDGSSFCCPCFEGNERLSKILALASTDVLRCRGRSFLFFETNVEVKVRQPIAFSSHLSTLNETQLRRNFFLGLFLDCFRSKQNKSSQIKNEINLLENKSNEKH